jgi:hypothetical protein
MNATRPDAVRGRDLLMHESQRRANKPPTLPVKRATSQMI